VELLLAASRAGLRDRYRCIVPDHVGMGLSDKPDDAAYRYTLQSRVDDLATLLERSASMARSRSPCTTGAA
jgi:pimeloyl-ACP methyl ester carboxylesterase